jgi:enoyl-CoA hydratase/carnithine racemase
MMPKPSPVQAVVMRDRAAWIQWLLKDLDHLEAMAAAAQPSESGLTEAQEDFGEHRALELIYTGRLLNGTEATEWDLVNRAVPEDESLDETLAVARRVAAGPTQAFRLSNRITHRITDAALSFDAVFATEADAQGEATSTADYTEGITAFQTKGEPSFTGRPGSVRHSSLRFRYPQYDHLAL